MRAFFIAGTPMATQNLTPEQLAWLQQQQYQAPSSGSGWSQDTAYGPMGGNVNQTAGNGDTFHTTYNSSGSVADGGINYSPTGLLRDVQAGHNQPGDMQEVYDTLGRYQATGAIPSESFMSKWGPFLMAAAPMALTAMGVAGAAGAAGGATGGMTNGAFLGEAPWSATGGGALDFGAAGGAAGGGAAAAGGGSSLLGGLGSKIAGAVGSGSGLLGTAATVLGGLAGASKPPGTDVQKTMDPRLDALVYGDNGLFSRTQGLLGQQMDPARSQGWRDMQAKGQGLLQQPIAGNGFERFYGGR